MKNVMRSFVFTIQICLFLAIFSACNQNEDEEVSPSIASIAVTNPNFSTLEDAAIRGGVAVVLSNKNPNDPQGNYTVFAPTNDAFAKLGLVDAASLLVLQPSFLTNTLLYHVSNGALASSQIMAGNLNNSLLDLNRRFISRDGDLYINGSKIILTDVSANNGTVHAIDKVMIATGADIVQSAIALASANVFVGPELSFLVEAVVYCELVDALSASAGSPSFTVFAPSDQAFKDLGVLLGEPLEVPADIRKLDKDLVTAVLLNHVVNNGGRFTPEFPAGSSVETLGGGMLAYGAFSNGVLTVQGDGNEMPANMVIPDVQCINGVVHVIDRVLLPAL